MFKNKETKINGCQKGFTLIELMITIFIISVGLISITNLIQNTLQSASIVRLNLTAAYLAQEGIELTRNIRDTNWIQNRDWNHGLNCPDGCQIQYDNDSLYPYTGSFLSLNNDNFYIYGGGQVSKFQREITIEPISDYLEVKSEIFWEDSGENQSIKAMEHLYDWR